MGKSLGELLGDMEGNNLVSTQEQTKKVKCPNCGRFYPAPGHPSETLCSNCITVRDTNNAAITDRYYGMRRNDTTVRKKRSVLIPSIDSTRSFKKTVDDQT